MLYKVELSRYSGFFFYSVKNGSQETQGRGAGQRVTDIGGLFFLQVRSFEIYRHWSTEYQSVAHANSFFSRTKSGFEN